MWLLRLTFMSMIKHHHLSIIFRVSVLILLVTALLPSCKSTTAISSSSPAHSRPSVAPPEFSEADRAYADVYKVLDGTWKGDFIIYEDTQPRSLDEIDLKSLTQEHIKVPSIREINRINVTQVYSSESPYFQRVKITDYYPDSGKEEISTGVNKVENGMMWCIVNKPSETIIHEGSTPSPNTIIWQSHQDSPQKIEYFQETVSADFYEIIGYGYYVGDDATVSPRLWFYSKYERQ